MSNYFNITPSTGSGSRTFSATTQSTNLTYSARTATLVITDGYTTKTVTLRQNPLPHLESTASPFPQIVVGSGGGEVFFSIVSDFYVCFSGANQSIYTLFDDTAGTQIPFGVNYMDDSTFMPDASHVYGIEIPGNTSSSPRVDTIKMYHWIEGSGGIGTVQIAPYGFTLTITTEAAG